MNRTIIDISANPGRRLRRKDYLEVVSGTMWFSPRFLELTGGSLSEVAAIPGVQFTREEHGVTKVTALNGCFTSSEGVERQIQEQLRAALFPRTGRES